MKICIKRGYKRPITKIRSDTMERQKCEVYSRVVGFITPVSKWNNAKQEEWKDRQEFEVRE